MYFVNLLIQYIYASQSFNYLKSNQSAAQQLLQRNECKIDLISSYSGGLVAYCWQNFTKLNTTPTVIEF